jgi:hypothetical protein
VIWGVFAAAVCVMTANACGDKDELDDLIGYQRAVDGRKASSIEENTGS